MYRKEENLMPEQNYKANQRVKPAPKVRKLGTVACVMEQTPIVWKNRLMLAETLEANHIDNTSGRHCFRIRDLDSGECSPLFGMDYYFSSAYTENDVVYVFGTSRLDDRPQTIYETEDVQQWHDPRGGHTVRMFWSDDLASWREKDIITIPEWRLWNTSVCKGPDGYVMAIEVCLPEGRIDDVVGHPFTEFFATSKDLMSWEMKQLDCCYTRERYNACPALRYADGYYYMICLEALPAVRYLPYIYRTENFIDWEVGFHNPMLYWSEEDRIINPGAGVVFTDSQIDSIQKKIIINVSDVDLCEYKGQTHIYYAIGDQMLWGSLAEAVYDGPLDEYLQAHFA
jgi:alpha-L-fucosidase